MKDTSVKFTRSDSDTKARYGGTVDGYDGESELTVSKVSPSLIIVDHTYVPDTMRGLGMAKSLAERVISDAREGGQRIVPLCPFFRAHAEKHREALNDVIQW